jgi:hypothetical protein
MEYFIELILVKIIFNKLGHFASYGFNQGGKGHHSVSMRARAGKLNEMNRDAVRAPKLVSMYLTSDGLNRVVPLSAIPSGRR